MNNEIVIVNQKDQLRIKDLSKLKTHIINLTEKYKNLVYTDEQIPVAEKELTALRKYDKLIENTRIEEKKKLLDIYAPLEADVKELTEPLKECIKNISEQVNTYKLKQEEEKRADIQTFFIQNIGDLKGMLTIQKIWNEKWLNKGYSIKNIQEEILRHIESTSSGLETLDGFNMPDNIKPVVVSKYLDTLDMNLAMSEKTRLEEDIKRQAEYKEKKKKDIEQIKDTLDTQPVKDAEAVEEKSVNANEKKMITLRLTGTIEQLKNVKQFMIDEGVVFDIV